MLFNQKTPRGKYHISTKVIVKSFLTLLFSRLKRGTSVKKFESELKGYYGHDFIFTLSSCRMAVYHTLKALDLPKGSEVLLTPITIPDIVNAISSLGLRPVFIDMDLDTHNANIADLKEKVTDKSKVLLLTHLGGIVPRVSEIVSVARDLNLLIIEDISQSHGARYKGKLLGTFGDVSVVSLSSGKTISSFVGGIILTSNSELAPILSEQLRHLHRPSKRMFYYQIFDCLKINFFTSNYIFSAITYFLLRLIGRFSKYGIDDIDRSNIVNRYSRRDLFFDNEPILRSKMPREFDFYFCDWQAKIALETLSNFERDNRIRSYFSKLIADELSLDAKKLFSKNALSFSVNNSYHLPMFWGKSCERAREMLMKRGLDTCGYGLNLCSHEKCFDSFQSETRIAKKIKEEFLFFPIHQSFSKDQIRRNAKIVNEVANLILGDSNEN